MLHMLQPKKARLKAMLKKDKIQYVMNEYKQNKLHSSSGQIVRKRNQALAIALSEQRNQRRRKINNLVKWGVIR